MPFRREVIKTMRSADIEMLRRCRRKLMLSQAQHRALAEAGKLADDVAYLICDGHIGEPVEAGEILECPDVENLSVHSRPRMQLHAFPKGK